MPETRHTPDRDPERIVRDYVDLVLRVCYTYLRSTAGTCGTQSGWPSRRLVAIKARNARPSTRACPGGACGPRASCGFSGRRGAFQDECGMRPRTSVHFCQREAV